jgi:excisionase family DNA binding protein
MDTDYITISEASAYLKLSKPSLYSYTSRKKIPHIKLSGKVLFDKNDLDNWINSKKHKEEE